MKKNILKWSLRIIIVGILIVGGVILYLFNEPHRDIQATSSDYKLASSALVKEYLTNVNEANTKYLDADGNSKIITVTGKIAQISEDLNHQKVILLKNENDKAGVSCTFMETTNSHIKNLKIGYTTTIKGVIRSGANYDEDLELYEDVILEKCDVTKK